MITVTEVERVNSVEVSDGYYLVKFYYDREKGKLRTVFRGKCESRMCEPIYIPAKIYRDFVRKAYAVFYRSRKSKKIYKGYQLEFSF